MYYGSSLNIPYTCVYDNKRLLVGKKRSLFSPKHPERLCGPSSLTFNGHHELFFWAYFPENEADHTSPTNSKFKNEGAIHLLPRECLHGEHGGNTTSFLGMFARLSKKYFTVIQIVSTQEYYMYTNYY